MSSITQLEDTVRGLLEVTINPSLDDPYAQLADLNSVIETVESLLTKLILHRAPLKSKINGFNSPIIQLLPAEVVSDIFEFCLPDFYTFDAKCEIQPVSVTPFLLGAICRRWREIAWTTPSLWSRLHLHFSGQNFRSLTDLAEQWLLRSGELPLSIRVSCEPKSSSKTALFVAAKEQLIALIKVFNLYSVRWINLDIRIPTSFFEYFALGGLHTSSLESLYIDPPDGQSDNGHTIWFQSSPLLKKVHLSSVYLKSIQAQWDNITHVYASSFYVDECLQIIERSPRLICCKFSVIIGGEAPYPMPDAPLVAQSLRFLHVGHERSVSAAFFFDKLTLPALEEFIYEASEKNIELPSFLSLLERSSCQLQAFTLKHTEVSEDDFISLLERMPTLRRLTIDIHNLAVPILRNPVLERLYTPSTTKGGSGQYILPALERLQYEGPQSFSWINLVNALMRRADFHFTTKDSETTPNEESSTSRPPILQAAKISLTSLAPNSNPLDESVLPHFFPIIEQQTYLEISVVNHEKDLLENKLQESLPDELPRYLALRQKMHASHVDPFSTANNWGV